MKITLLSVENVVKTGSGFAAGVAATLGAGAGDKDKTFSFSDYSAKPTGKEEKCATALLEMQRPKQVACPKSGQPTQGPPLVDADAYFILTNS